jgi:prepilin-type N-terminal cleavage/methylation domain-containing protein
MSPDRLSPNLFWSAVRIHFASSRLPSSGGHGGCGKTEIVAGFTLIEMIGVLAIISILATVILFSTTRRLDSAAASLERTNLSDYASALESSILRNRYIPGPNDWATVIAAETGASVASVTNSPRNTPRYFLIDPALQIGTNAVGFLPYAQSNLVLAIGASNQTIQPVSPRIMIVSTLSTTLPRIITSGTVPPSVFRNLWNWTDQSSTPPAGWPPEWNGRGTDLIVQRVNLTPLFIRLVLQNYPPPPFGGAQGRYAVDRMPSPPITVPNAGNGVDIYLLRNSMLGLYQDAPAGGALQAEQIINRDSTFFYIQGVWRGSLTFGTNLTQTTTEASAMGSVFYATAQAFVSSPYYSNAANGLTPPRVVNSMSNFMFAYINWANSSFNPAPLFKKPAADAETKMQQDMADLVSGISPNGLVAGACTNPPTQ